MRTLPLLVVISGPSCSGKTALGERLAADLVVPFLSKDAFKERLFDTLGWHNCEWSRQLGRASTAVLFQAMESVMAAGGSLVAESVFRSEWDSDRLSTLCQRYGQHPIQIQCVCDGAVLLARWRTRTASGERHPGHVERECEDEFRPGLLRGRFDPLTLDGPLIRVDTTDFAAVDYPALLETVRRHVAQA